MMLFIHYCIIVDIVFHQHQQQLQYENALVYCLKFETIAHVCWSGFCLQNQYESVADD